MTENTPPLNTTSVVQYVWELVKKQGLSVIIICMVAYFFYMKSTSADERLLHEYTELKMQVKELSNKNTELIQLNASLQAKIDLLTAQFNNNEK